MRHFLLTEQAFQHRIEQLVYVHSKMILLGSLSKYGSQLGTIRLSLRIHQDRCISP